MTLYRVSGPALPTHCRRGVTLIEAVLFISVALGLIVGGIVFYQQASLAARTNAQGQVLSAIAAEARAIYLRGGFQIAFDGAPVLVAAGAVPAHVIVENPGAGVSPLRTEWGTELLVWIGNPVPGGGGIDDVSIDIILTDVPVEACTRLGPITDAGEGVFTNGLLFIFTIMPFQFPMIGVFPGDGPAEAAAACQAGDAADGADDGLVSMFISLAAVTR